MYDSSDPEVELYEEVVGDMYLNTPPNTQNLSTVTVAETPTIPSTFHRPTVSDSSRRTVEATDPFAHAPRPVLRYPDELADITERPRSGVAVTIVPLQSTVTSAVLVPWKFWYRGIPWVPPITIEEAEWSHSDWWGGHLTVIRLWTLWTRYPCNW